MISIHFGDLIEREEGPPAAKGKKRGTWVITLWDCDRQLTVDGDVIDSRVESEDDFFERLGTIETETVSNVAVDATSLSLAVRFDSGKLLALLVDGEARRDAEQWTFEAPGRRSMSVFGERFWAIEAN